MICDWSLMGIECVTLHSIAVLTSFEFLKLKQNLAQNFTFECQ